MAPPIAYQRIPAINPTPIPNRVNINVRNRVRNVFIIALWKEVGLGPAAM